jgi:hypothetical protein
MKKSDAKELVKNYTFTKKELYDILEEALASEADEYWKKPNKANKIFDNGAYFNLCVEWVNYKAGINDNERCLGIVAFRVLHEFGKYSKKQLSKKEKSHIDIKYSELPKLK